MPLPERLTSEDYAAWRGRQDAARAARRAARAAAQLDAATQDALNESRALTTQRAPASADPWTIALRGGR